MGMMTGILGLGRAAGEIGEVAEALVGNRAERDAADHAREMAVLEQFGAEFAQAPNGPFDRFVDGLNRLPRPLLALGTIGLFGHAMAEPIGFALRMEGLASVPEPLWWLLGVIVSFYFGARELHHYRSRTGTVRPTARPGPAAATTAPRARAKAAPKIEVRAEDPEFNAALAEWRALNT